ncbi:MAG: pyrroline-5-carboxylate reductase [Sphaerochaetaceae bacterium]|jgi:pyrroline-5-carboxylate reductase
MTKIGFIGCGNMGGAIATSLSKLSDWAVMLHDSDAAKANALAQTLSVPIAGGLKDLVQNNQILLIAVKPQVLPTLYRELRTAGAKDRRWISIAAGVPLDILKKELETEQVVRFMPNIAATVGKAVTAVAASHGAEPSFVEAAFEIARSCGSAFPLAEKDFPAFIGISGSAIAYAFQFFHALAMGGVDEGIPYPTALEIARDTCVSAASLQESTGKGAVELATMVCSAGGTTIQGMKALAEGRFDATVMDAVSAAARKSRSMEEAARKH